MEWRSSEGLVGVAVVEEEGNEKGGGGGGAAATAVYLYQREAKPRGPGP